jgi:uncharacterized protein YidB (DUF937 family)
MGLFDDLLKTGLQGMIGNSQQGQSGLSLAFGIIQMLTSPQTGGLQGLVENFTQKGLGDIVSSWVSTGPNLPVSMDQLNSALGPDAIQSLAQKAGVAPEMAGSVLSQVLPVIVDKLTPDGKLPEGGGILEQSLGLFKGLNR